MRSVQVQLGNSGSTSISEPKLRAAFGSQEDPVHRRAEQEAPRLTTEALAARRDSLQHLRRGVAASISRSVCPASSSTATLAGGPEEEGKFRRRINEYILHEEYYKSVTGEDGEEPLDTLGSPPYTDMGSYPYSGPPTDLADTVCPYGVRAAISSRGPEGCPAYVKESHLPEPTHGALDRTAELLAKLLSGSEDPDVTALSEAAKATLGITEPLPQPALASLSPRLKQIVKTCSTWADVLQRLDKTFPIYETDLSVRTQIEELPMLPEFPSAARVSEYVCNLGYLFTRMNVGSYGATEPHLWLMRKIPSLTCDDCRTTSERKSRSHTYDDLVDLLIELALERENDSHMEKFLRKHLFEPVPLPPSVGVRRDLKIPLTPTRVVVKQGVICVP